MVRARTIGGYAIPAIVVFFFWLVVVILHWAGGGHLDLRLGHFVLDVGFT
jgi:hypothetical protein